MALRQFSLRTLLVLVAVFALLLGLSIRIETATERIGFAGASHPTEYRAAQSDLGAFLTTSGYSPISKPAWSDLPAYEDERWYSVPSHVSVFVRSWTEDSRLGIEVVYRKRVISPLPSVMPPQDAGWEIARHNVLSWALNWQAVRGIGGDPPSDELKSLRAPFPGSPLLPPYRWNPQWSAGTSPKATSNWTTYASGQSWRNRNG